MGVCVLCMCVLWVCVFWGGVCPVGVYVLWVGVSCGGVCLYVPQWELAQYYYLCDTLLVFCHVSFRKEKCYISDFINTDNSDLMQRNEKRLLMRL